MDSVFGWHHYAHAANPLGRGFTGGMDAKSMKVSATAASATTALGNWRWICFRFRRGRISRRGPRPG